MIWLRRLALVFAGTLWFFGVFVLSFWLTFPSTAMADFAKWKVQDGLGGKWILAVDAISPSAFGIRADNVGLFQKDRRGQTETFSADTIYVRTGPWSVMNLALLGRVGTVSGSIDGKLVDFTFSTSLGQDDKGALKMRGLNLNGNLPLAAIPAIQETHLLGTGGVDIDVDLVAENGLAKSNGTISVVEGDAIVLQKLEGGMLGGTDLQNLDISVLELKFDVKNGKAKVATGQLACDWFTVDFTGEMSLSDVLMQSRLRLKLEASFTEAFDTQFALLKGVLASALWDDGRYHYKINGTLGNPQITPDSVRKARGTGGGAKSMPRVGTQLMPGDMPAVMPEMGGGTVSGDDDAAAEERRKRREEAISERRARLEERRKQLGSDNPRRPAIATPDEEPGFGPDDGGAPLDEPPYPPDDVGGVPGGPPEDDMPPPEEF